MNRLNILFLTTALGSLLLSQTPLLAQSPLDIRVIPDEPYALASKAWMQEYASREITELGPFTSERQLYIYETLQFRAHALWASPEQHVLADLESRLDDPPGLRVQITDSDGNGKADQWMHQFPGQEYSPDLGFMFDLNQDGELDYFVFNGGPSSYQKSFSNVEDMFGSIFWFNYHWIDSNHDGYVDIHVINDADPDEDGLADRGMSVWLYDDNSDGLVDRAEYRGYTACFPMWAESREAWIPEAEELITISIPLENDVFTINRAEPFGESEINPQEYSLRLGENLAEVKAAVHSVEATQVPENLTVQELYDAANEANETGNYVKAVAFFRRVVERAPEHADAFHTLGRTLLKQRRFEEAVPIFQTALRLRRNNLDSEHIDIAESLYHLASAYFGQENYEAAEPLFYETLEILEANFGSDHRYIAATLHSLGSIAFNRGDYATAESFYQRAYKMRRKVLGKSHPSTIGSMYSLANTYERQGRTDEAAKLRERAYRRSP